ncbi:MAG: purine-nucleoside phosphorylase [[Eubacterium] sulci]|jgi:purine nucleoside phosphorylase I, inosine and guanosine-specific|nr:purine-nucleoside phosphorylase [[Eubacterium] sulci]
MNKEFEKINHCLEQIRSKTDFEPLMAVVLGSGLGGYASKMEVVCEIPYSEIDGFPVSTVQGHDGRFLFGYVEGVPIVAMKGRVHFYEGYAIDDVVLPIRTMGLLGAKYILLTNAAGGIDLDFEPGDLMLIEDHISSFIRSPLIGENIEELGVRFPDMSRVYDLKLCECIRRAASSEGIDIKEGTYLQTSGPQFETSTEIKMFRTLGASAVGMSTVVEAIAAHHMGLRVCGISCISNMAAGILDQPLTHSEVQITADKVAHKFERLVSGLIKEVSKLKEV